MTTSPNDLENQRADARRFQFSLRTLLIGTTMIAMLCSGLLAAPEWVSVLTLWFAVFSLPAVVTTVVIYGRGYQRTFAIGALFPAACVFVAFGFRFLVFAEDYIPFPNDLRLFVLFSCIFLAIAVGMTVAVGLLVVWVRWLIESPRRPGQQEAASPESSDPSSPSAD